MKRILFGFALCVFSFCHANLGQHLRKDTPKQPEEHSIQNVDRIYLINLDQRPEKLEKSLSQLKPYQVVPHRFSAIYGWDLSAEVLNDVGVQFRPGMFSGEWAFHYPLGKAAKPEVDFLREECYGNTYVCCGLTPGAVGCYLSHLSVLQDAYDSGYQTIWVIEDDIAVERDPHQLSTLINKLDALVGKEGWDILYTDTDIGDKCGYDEENDFESDLKGGFNGFWRPDIDLSDCSSLRKRTILSEDFLKIGSRMRTHSMIVRRSGMKKILDFYKASHIFLPYDHELSIVPDIRLFSLRYDLVTHGIAPSDTKANPRAQQDARNEEWMKCKQAVLSEVPQILGWRDPKKAEALMEFVRETQPKTCVEIGAFAGAVTLPIAQALNFLKEGVVYAIDAWDIPTATLGLKSKKSIEWWRKIDMSAIHQQFMQLINGKKLMHCHPVRQTSKEAVSLFSDGSVDLLFLDGNESRETSLEDAVLYLPKVKEGGYIWLNQADTSSKKQTVAYLMKHCKWIKEKSLGISCVLFQKITAAPQSSAPDPLPGLLNIHKPYVTAQLKGQMGNNLFEVAAACALAWDHHAEPYFEDFDPNSPLYQHVFFRCNRKLPRHLRSLWYEPSYAYQPISYRPDMQICGLFQSEKYFSHYRDRLLALFAPHPEDLEYIQTKYQHLLDAPNTVGVQLRYYRSEGPEGEKYPQYGKDFVEKAMAHFPKSSLFVVSSNNLDYARTCIPGWAKNVVFIENEPDYIDFFLLSLCKHNIITNSSFGWWSAWLNQNPGKIVVRPKLWIKGGLPTEDICPKEWVVIDANEDLGDNQVSYPVPEKNSSPFGIKKIDIVSPFDVGLFFLFPEDFKKANVELSTNSSISKVFFEPNQAEKIMVFNFLIEKEALARIPKDRLSYFLWEPWEVPYEYYQAYDKVYTYNDDLVDNVKFFKIYYPSLQPMEKQLIPFREKKFCTMVVSADIDPQDRKNDLRSERMRMVEFFETKPKGELEIYGTNWKRRTYRDYVGAIPGYHSGPEKIATLKQYRFAICFENTKINGYITEKIFCCFAAGCVPVYWGAGNIERYIPKGCYIDYRDFDSREALYQFMKNMSEKDYENYLANIREFLISEKAQLFSPKHFQQFFSTLVSEPK